MHNASPTTWTYMLRSLLAHPRLALSLSCTLLLSQSCSHWRSLDALLGLSCISLRALHLRLFLGLVVVVARAAVLPLLHCYCAAFAISFLFCFAFNAFWQQIANHCGISHSLTHTPSPTHAHSHTRLESTPSLSLSLSRILWLFVISFSTAAAEAEATNFFDKQRMISNLCISLYSFFFRETPYRSPSCLSTSHTFT